MRADPMRATSLPAVLLVGPRPTGPVTGGVEKGIDMLLRTGLARRANMRVFNNYRRRDPRRPFYNRLRYQWGMIRSFRREMSRQPVGLIHVKTSSGINFHQNALYALVARWRGLPVLLQIHGGKFETFYRESHPLLRVWIRHALSTVNAVAVLSRSWADRIARIAPAARLVVIPNGMEASEMTSLSRSGERRPGRVLFIGTGDPALNDEKGLADLLDVLPGLLLQYPASSWVLAGLHDPGAVRELIEKSLEPGTQHGSRVTCLPCVAGDARLGLFRGCSILVLPSHYENMPNVLLEAMAAGMGVVASNVGAIPEMLGAPEGGILFQAGDRAGLADAVQRLLSSPSLVSDQGRRNIVTVSREYAMEAVERKLERIYLELGEGESTRRSARRSLAATRESENWRP